MIKQAGIYAQSLTALAYKCLMLLSMVFLTNIFTGCTEDNEPNETSPSNPDNHVTINADGTATGGAVFSPIDDTTFLLDYVKYEIVDAHLEIIGYDGSEISSEPKLYAEVKINGVTYKTRILRDGCFRSCSKLKSTTIPSTVTELGSACFDSCTNLQSIKLPDKLATIGGGCFYNCSQLRSIVLPSKVESLRQGCFARCKNLQSIELPDELNYIGFYCFSFCTKLNSIVLPSKVESLEECCFTHCENLQSIELSDELNYIGYQCFGDCTQLRSVTFKNKIPQHIDISPFDDCSNIIAYVPLHLLEEFQWLLQCREISEVIGY